MSTFCSLEEAFMGPIVVPGQSKKKKRRDGGSGVGIEHFVPAPLSSTPATKQEEETEADDVLQGPPGPTKKLQAGGSSELDSFFPLPGETADPEEWQKAFVLQPSQIPQPLQQQMQHKAVVPMLSNGAIAVNGQPTLWRQIPEPLSQPLAAAPVPSEINKRLDALTRQLEALTTPTPLQSTAELFLFVAIGLMILLAIDSLLRFASGSMQSSRMDGGSRMGSRIGGRIGGRMGSVRWRGGGW
jgi:hypothetical protein